MSHESSVTPVQEKPVPILTVWNRVKLVKELPMVLHNRVLLSKPSVEDPCIGASEKYLTDCQGAGE